MHRRLVLISAVTALAVAGGAWVSVARPWEAAATADAIGPRDQAVAAAEQARSIPGAKVDRVRLVAAPSTVQLGGRQVSTWAFNGTVPGPQLTPRAGDVVSAEVVNRLPAPLTIHWHGIALRNDMDGVPGVTQSTIKPGGSFTYTFTVAEPGTYFYHSHVGTQLDRGLYGALVVQPRKPDTSAARDVTVLLDDWVDGTGRSPDKVYDDLRTGSMPGMDMGSMPGMGTDSMPGMDMSDSGSAQSPLGDDTADLNYPLYLINGRDAADPSQIQVPAGRPVRLRLVNAASATPFRVAVAGRQLTVVATDGYAVKPVTVDTLIIGMGERYDVLVNAPSTGTAALVAAVEGRSASALAVLRSGPGAAPAAGTRPPQLSGRLLTYSDLQAIAGDALAPKAPDATYQVALTGDMASYRWGIKTSADGGGTIPVRQGQRVRLVLTNRTAMWHPIHLHGHTFQLVSGSAPGPRKDTVIVPAMGTVTIDFDADNPGQWLLHCHNAYHAEAGMLTKVSYVR